MTEPRIMLATLALNEMEWLPRLYEQHKDWPGLVAWTFVEGADPEYARANPEMVRSDGSSSDGTTEWLRETCSVGDDTRLFHMLVHNPPAGSTADQGKTFLRNLYLERVAEYVKPDFLIVLDADEFYSKDHQAAFNRLMTTYKSYSSFCLNIRHPWRPPLLADKMLFKFEVTGGFWAMDHCHCFRWEKGLRYRANHNTPETAGGVLLNKNMLRKNLPWPKDVLPTMIHMAFASSLRTRQAKHRYYVGRGEGKTDKRQWYVDSRAAWETWTPGDKLPRGAEIVPWQGPVPECFRELA